MMERRYFLFGLGAIAAIGTGAVLLPTRSRNTNFQSPTDAATLGDVFEIQKSDAEWRALLTEDQFAVLREEETERQGSSPLLNEKRDGAFHCVGCALPLYRSIDKYDSKTGWPSFTRSIPGAIGTKPDNSLFVARTEVHCRRCSGHLGHIFDDGPEPAGERHCLNGVALAFVPASDKPNAT